MARHAAPAHADAAGAARQGRGYAIALVLLFLVGAAIMLYPAYSYLWGEYQNAVATSQYRAQVQTADVHELDASVKRAQAYNRAHVRNVVADPFGDAGSADGDEGYAQQLALFDDGMMGYLEIPKIGQALPVYHGISGRVLESGVGHLPGTSLPVGGEGSHCVLSGHRGLPTKKLFTDLDQLGVGDQVLFHTMGEHLAYEVESVRVVKPDQVDALDIQPGRDLLTLVTCAPYAVNTHRMLVTCHRVPWQEAEAGPGDAFSWLAAFSPQTLALAGGFTLVAAVGLVALVRRLRKRDR